MSLTIPTISWRKELKPQSDEAHLDLIEKLDEKYPPIRQHVMEAAYGYPVDELDALIDRVLKKG